MANRRLPQQLYELRFMRGDLRTKRGLAVRKSDLGYRRLRERDPEAAIKPAIETVHALPLMP
jgi:hypothetical protein